MKALLAGAFLAVLPLADAFAQATSGSHIQYGIVYNSTLQQYEVYYQANSLAPASPATTSTAQLFIVVPDPTSQYTINTFTLNTAYNNGTWAKGDYVNGPIENPTADYFGINLASAGTTDIEFNAVNTPALLFTFTVPGGCISNLSIITDTDPFWYDPFTSPAPNSQSLNVNNNMDVLFPTTPTASTWNPGYLSNYTGSTGPCTVLPVSLLDFTATRQGHQALLQWQTVTEQDCDRFEIEHSTDGRSWKKTGSVKAAGNTTLQQQYSFVHETPAPGANYYRLRQVDYNGKEAYSSVRKVIFDEGASQPLVYPNPADKQLFISNLSGKEEVLLLNTLGQVVVRKTATAGSMTLDIAHLPAGTYQLLISLQGQSLKAEKVVKQ